MKKILIIAILLFSAALFAGIPHPVFVEYSGDLTSFEAYIASDTTNTVLTQENVGCEILSEYNLIMVECGNFFQWEFGDLLYVIKSDSRAFEHTSVILDYNNIQGLAYYLGPDPQEYPPGWDIVYWNDGLPGDVTVDAVNVLAPGWNLWSHNFELSNSLVDSVFKSLDHLEKVKSITQSYDPDLSSQFNTLITIEDGYGYWVNVAELDTLDFTLVTPLNPDSVLIDLDYGWNLIGYIPQEADSVSHAYGVLKNAGQLEKVKSITQSYDPDLESHFNTLKIVEPGHGYWINLNVDVENFTYPEPLDLTSVRKHLEYAWQPVIYTNSTCAYATINEDYGQIGAFAGNECRGVTEINNSFVSLVINGEIKEKINFKLYQNGVISELNTEIYSDPGDDIFFEITDQIPARNEIINVYPNPFNPQTLVTYQISKMSQVMISVYNIKGQKVSTLVNDHVDAGIHTVEWNPQNASSGVYFIKMKINDHSSVKKAMLIK